MAWPKAGHVDERLVRLMSAVPAGGDIVHVDADDAGVFPAQAVVEEESDVLGHARHAEVAPVAERAT